MGRAREDLADTLSLLEKSVVFSVNLRPNNVFGVPPQRDSGARGAAFVSIR